MLTLDKIRQRSDKLLDRLLYTKVKVKVHNRILREMNELLQKDVALRKVLGKYAFNQCPGKTNKSCFKCKDKNCAVRRFIRKEVKA